MMRRLALALVAMAPMVAGAYAATAAGTATGKPVDIEADQMEVLDAEKTAIFRGSVNATRADVHLTCDELVVKYNEVKQPDGSTKTDATDLSAKGYVLIKTAKETITGDWAKYNPQTSELVVGGSVKLVQGSTILMGEQLKANLDTDKIEMGGGRVKGSFLPK